MDSPKNGKCSEENNPGFRWHIHDCPFMKLDPDDKSFDYERYLCTKCGARDSLDYEEMK